MSVVRWVFDYGGAYSYQFPRNPDRYSDTGWQYESRVTEFEIIGANTPTLQFDGFRGARRRFNFTAISGAMMRILQDFYFRGSIISNCRDHLYPTLSSFNCFIINLVPTLHPTVGSFPGSGEDTWDLEMTIIKM